MISTEVHRTLVKSPPELWAELSDPAALAKHLGELGEIRITRLEPGEKVEWEATDTSGTVILKPSGWGTKVTLTATSDAHDAPAPTAAAPDAPAPTAAAPDAPGPTVAAPDAAAPATPEPDAPPGPEPAAGREPAADREPVAVREPAADPPPGPAIDAWRELAAAASAETGFQLAPRAATAPAPATGDGPVPVQSEPRRGLFARLFRRRRTTFPASPAPIRVSLAPVPASPAPVPASPAPVPASAPPGDGAAAESPALAPVERAKTEPMSTPKTLPAAGALPAGDAPARPRSGAPSERPAEPRAAQERSFDGAANAAPGVAGPGQGPETVASPPDPPDPDAGPASPPEPSSAGAAIPAGSAADRVTAVLTATLDRLGAAHHRPFSRA